MIKVNDAGNEKENRTRQWDDVYSIKGGVVKEVGNASNGNSYGNYVVVQDENGIYSKYGHLDSVSVKVGDTVVQGEFLGQMGKTGRGVPGPNKHLHVNI